MTHRSPAAFSRRTLLVGSAALAAGASAAALLPGRIVDALRLDPARPGARLGRLIVNRLGSDEAMALVREHKSLIAGGGGHTVPAAMAADFRAGRTLRIDGWLLSRTECAVCVASVLASA